MRAGQTTEFDRKAALAMTRSNSNRVRLTGKLIKGERRYILQSEDESIWRLNLIDVNVPIEAAEVTIEGVQSGVDNVDVDWIGQFDRP